MSARDSFIFYRSFYEALIELPDDERLIVMDAIMAHQFSPHSATEIRGIPRTIFTLIKPQLDANNRRYENGKKGASYGRLGGRPKRIENPKITPRKPLENPKITPNKNVNVNENVNKKVINYSSEFLEFWEIYPRQRRGSKETAFKEWTKALTKATEQEIINGTRAYAVSDEVRRGYAKQAAGWLKDERWGNQYATTRDLCGTRTTSPTWKSEGQRIRDDIRSGNFNTDFFPDGD